MKIDSANTDHCGCCEMKYIDNYSATAPDAHKSANANANANATTNDSDLLPYCM
jgi:hypothetical protein